MSKFEKVKEYYDRGLWSKKRVHNAVGKWITEEEYKKLLARNMLPKYKNSVL